MKPIHLFVIDLLLAGAAVFLISSCMTAVPPSPQVQADVGDGVVATSGTMTASPQRASRAASQTSSFYGR